MAIGGQTVVVVRRQRPGPGQPVVDTGEQVTVRGCFVEPRGETGSTGYGDSNARQMFHGFRVYGPQTLSTISALDHVEIDGWLVGSPTRVRSSIGGRPAVWPNLRGRVDHVELDVLYSPRGFRSITVVRPAGRDRHGDITGSPSEHTIPDCVIVQTSSDEAERAMTTKVDVYVRDGTVDIRADDRVRLDTDPTPTPGAGMRAQAPWIVAGSPGEWQAPFQDWDPGLLVKLERYSG